MQVLFFALERERERERERKAHRRLQEILGSDRTRQHRPPCLLVKLDEQAVVITFIAQDRC